MPPRSLPVRSLVGGWDAAALYAVVRSLWACRATASVLCCAPLSINGGIPVMELPGDTPRSPKNHAGAGVGDGLATQHRKAESRPEIGIGCGQRGVPGSPDSHSQG